MMAANYQSSKETTNFSRICRLIVDVVSDLLRDLLLTRLPTSGLSTVLTTQKSKMCSWLPPYLKKILYPGGGVYQGSVKDLDTTLLYILLRNIVNITPHQNGWGENPDIADRTLSANIDRLHEQRNLLFPHVPNTSLSDGDFQASWDIIRQSVKEIQNSELNTDRFVVAVDEMLTMEMDHRMTNKYIEELLLDVKEPAQPAPPAQSAYQGVPLEKYKMESDPRGLCLIINNKNYMTLPCRTGTDVERDQLRDLFHQLNFKVVIKDDLPGMEMKLQLEELTRSEDLPRVDSLVICLLCHGDSRIVYGTDSVPLKLHDDTFKIFGPQSCPALKGKPKLFVVNSCSGEAGVVGTHSNTDSETDLSHDLPQNVPDAPSTTPLKDLYLAYSTFQGYLSNRSKVKGSWFVSKLVEVFSEQASTVEIDHMMREVNKRVADMYDVDSLAVQIPASMNTLTRQWYFNPVQLGETK